MFKDIVTILTWASICIFMISLLVCVLCGVYSVKHPRNVRFYKLQYRMVITMIASGFAALLLGLLSALMGG